MAGPAATIQRNSALDPASRIIEILFGLIMVLTFTSSIRAAEVVRADVREMLIGALGCNLAWGIIDAFMYLMTLAAERGREDLIILKLKANTNPAEARALLRETLPETFESAFSDSDLDQLGAKILKEDKPIRNRMITKPDLWAAFTVFGLVFLTIFPVAIPFMLIKDVWTALRISNLISLVLLFSLGYSLGSHAGKNPWRWGTRMTVIGIVLVGLAIALGG